MFDTDVMIKALLGNIGPCLDLANWSVYKAPSFLLVPDDLSVSIPANNIIVANCITLKDTALRFFRLDSDAKPPTYHRRQGSLCIASA